MFYILLATVGLVIWLFLSEAYLLFIKTPGTLMPSARLTFLWVVAVTTIIVVSSPWKYTLIGLQRLDIINAIEVGISVPSLLATVWVLVKTQSPSQALYGMGIVQFVSYTIVSAVTVFYAWKITPGYRFDLRCASWASFLDLFAYGKSVNGRHDLLPGPESGRVASPGAVIRPGGGRPVFLRGQADRGLAEHGRPRFSASRGLPAQCASRGPSACACV